jgi:hypothetical protein
VESLYLGASSESIQHRFKSLEDELVQLYSAILELMAEIRTLATDGPIRTEHYLELFSKSANILLVQGLLYSSRLEIWKRINDVVSGRNGTCKTVFDNCKLTIDQHGKIKKWISEYKQDEVHLAAQQKTKVDTKYRNCGQWFLDSNEFNDWSSGKPGKEVLWFRGTSKGCFVSYVNRKLTCCSWNRKDYHTVSPVFLSDMCFRA